MKTFCSAGRNLPGNSSNLYLVLVPPVLAGQACVYYSFLVSSRLGKAIWRVALSPELR